MVGIPRYFLHPEMVCAVELQDRHWIVAPAPALPIVNGTFNTSGMTSPAAINVLRACKRSASMRASCSR